MEFPAFQFGQFQLVGGRMNQSLLDFFLESLMALLERDQMIFE
ncbi:protein of unknown function [Methylocella tundrae]|uniref:Uncharacterized protein n=1 Tax=Methylocella tundrae TaxID=227605 RepID=A0A4U8Z4E9_METTU|nr:protein of unknown function [Methylocella tundrae]